MLKGQAKGPTSPEEFERLVAPHVKSFDYFIGEGMETVVQLLEPLEVSSSSSRAAAVKRRRQQQRRVYAASWQPKIFKPLCKFGLS